MRFVDERVKTFVSGALRIVLYTVLYLIIGLIFLSIVINIHMISSTTDPLILKIVVSIGGGLSWVSILAQIGLVLGLIRWTRSKKT